MKIEKILDFEKVRTLVAEFVQLLIPTLSERNIDIDSYSEKIFRNGTLYGAVDINGEFMGILAAYMNDKEKKTAYLTILALKSKYRGLKLGEKLLCTAERDAGECGMKAFSLEVRKSNINAIDFYKAHGYSISADASETSYYMIKELS